MIILYKTCYTKEVYKVYKNIEKCFYFVIKDLYLKEN